MVDVVVWCVCVIYFSGGLIGFIGMILYSMLFDDVFVWWYVVEMIVCGDVDCILL